MKTLQYIIAAILIVACIAIAIIVLVSEAPPLVKMFVIAADGPAIIGINKFIRNIK